MNGSPIKKTTSNIIKEIRSYRFQPNLVSSDGSGKIIKVPIGECKADDIIILEINANVQNTSGVAKTLKYTLVSNRTSLTVNDVSTIANGAFVRIKFSFEFKCTNSVSLGQYAPFHLIRSTASGTPAVATVAAQLYGETSFNIFPNDNTSVTFNIDYTVAGGILVDFTKAMSSIIRTY